MGLKGSEVSVKFEALELAIKTRTGMDLRSTDHKLLESAEKEIMERSKTFIGSLYTALLQNHEFDVELMARAAALLKEARDAITVSGERQSVMAMLCSDFDYFAASCPESAAS